MWEFERHLRQAAWEMCEVRKVKLPIWDESLAFSLDPLLKPFILNGEERVLFYYHPIFSYYNR